mmetsp:Transcript_12980/g.37306  ORF Transcript_12980/g.37306 Transcript_12980/m.37306 type:complete len:220 (-) Transcript_12980:1017-1676(-)
MNHGFGAEPVVSSFWLVRLPPNFQIAQHVTAAGRAAKCDDDLSRVRVPRHHAFRVDALVPQYVIVLDPVQTQVLLEAKQLLVRLHLIHFVHDVAEDERLHHALVRYPLISIIRPTLVKDNLTVRMVGPVPNGRRQPQRGGRNTDQRQDQRPETCVGHELHRTRPDLYQPKKNQIEDQEHRARNPRHDVVAQDHPQQLEASVRHRLQGPCEQKQAHDIYH